MNDIMIKIQNLSKTFYVEKTEVVALSDINLEIRKGEIFGIIGLSGAGKSTLVRMINLLERPTEGKIFFEDYNLLTLSDHDLRQIRKRIGMIFQNFNLLEQRNVISNIMFPLELINMPKEERINRAKELLKLVDLEDKELAYPSQLSGGQKQRVAIARALATNPTVLLCDEATSALDPKTTDQILELLKKINKELNITIVIITHQMSVIENVCNRVAIINNSKIEEIGEVADVFRNPKTDIGRKLIFGNYIDSINDIIDSGNDIKKIRITFKGDVTNEPILAKMILECNDLINILYANVKSIDNNIYGEMMIELPKDEDKANMMKKYLNDHNITFWEVN